MRTLCCACEKAAAILFCAADEAALCRSCDDRMNDTDTCVLELQVHLCNKLAIRHVRVGLADPSDVPRCDTCENAPGMEAFCHLIFPFLCARVSTFFYWNMHVAFFYCEIDGSSLCLQCDMFVHVGGKRTHGRYLLLRQRVKFPGDKPGVLEKLGQHNIDQNEIRRDQSQTPKPKPTVRENQQNHRVSPIPVLENNADGDGKMDNKFIDLNSRPQ